MRLVRESISFQRGLDPKQALGVGKITIIKGWFDWAEAVMGLPIEYTIDDNLNIFVDQNLNLSNLPISDLPDNLTINGNLNISHTDITSLPKNLHVMGALALHKTSIRYLPQDLYVGGNVYMGSTLITSIPKGVKIEGQLFRDGVKIEGQ